MELEAALGACREKALELELRLKNAEERIHMQACTMQFNKSYCFIGGLQVYAACQTRFGGERKQQTQAVERRQEEQRQLRAVAQQQAQHTHTQLAESDSAQRSDS